VVLATRLLTASFRVEWADEEQRVVNDERESHPASRFARSFPIAASRWTDAAFVLAGSERTAHVFAPPRWHG
jgi:hypothetical protein